MKMGRRYYRRSYRKRTNQIWNGNVLLIVLLIVFFPIGITVLACYAVYKLIVWINSQKRYTAHQNYHQATDINPKMPKADHAQYSAKDSLMTDCEKKFYQSIKKVIGNRYVLQPQINLASIVSKESLSRYHNELFRNIDFGIFDQNYRLLVLIEINDRTHEQYARRDRDQKVKQICDEAKIPLVTFWTKYGVNETYIRERLKQYLNLNEKQV